jgi:hypothetical protein
VPSSGTNVYQLVPDISTVSPSLLPDVYFGPQPRERERIHSDNPCSVTWQSDRFRNNIPPPCSQQNMSVCSVRDAVTQLPHSTASYSGPHDYYARIRRRRAVLTWLWAPKFDAPRSGLLLGLCQDFRHIMVTMDTRQTAVGI